MKRVLVTGGTGFVGANLVRRLIEAGHEVHLVVRPGHKAWRINELRDHLQIHTGEMADPAAVHKIVGVVRPEWIFHLAVYGAYPDQTGPEKMVNTNILGTLNLVQACMGTGFDAFVNAGSSSEYGFKDHPPSETERVDPNSCYAVTKAAATHYCRHISLKHKVHLVTLRLSSVFGPYEEPSRLIPTLIIKGRNNELPALVDPEIARDLIYVDDVVESFLKTASVTTLERGAIYNVGSGKQQRLRDIVETVRNVLQIEAEPQWGTMPNRQWDTTTWVLDNRKIRQDLGWCPAHTFEQGLRLTVDWLSQSAHMAHFYTSRLL